MNERSMQQAIHKSLYARRIQMFSRLPEKYGNPCSKLEFHASDEEKLRFKQNRLFSILHTN